MKRSIIIFFGIINIILILFNVKLYFEYQEKKTVYNNYLEEYEKKSNEYAKVLSKIENLFNVEVKNAEDIDLLFKNLTEEIILLQSKEKELSNRESSLKKQKNTLASQYTKKLEEIKRANTFIIKNVEVMNQYKLGYPNGCESVALTTLLHFYKVNVSVKEVVSVLKKGELPYYEDGVRYGGNPYLEFIGDPSKSNSYGVYDKPIEDVANHFKPGIINGRGKKLGEILDIVKQNRPVLVWVSNNLAVPYVSQSWIYKPTGEKINWLKPLHALVIIGFNDTEVVVSDSIDGKIKYFNRKTFESRYKSYGQRALYY